MPTDNPKPTPIPAGLLIPDGYRLIDYRHPKIGELYLAEGGSVCVASFDFERKKYPILSIPIPLPSEDPRTRGQIVAADKIRWNCVNATIVIDSRIIELKGVDLERGRDWIAGIIDDACAKAVDEAVRIEGGRLHQAWKDGYASGCGEIGAAADNFRRDLAAKLFASELHEQPGWDKHNAKAEASACIEAADILIAELAKPREAKP